MVKFALVDVLQRYTQEDADLGKDFAGVVT